MKKTLFLTLQSWLPQHALSRLAGVATESTYKPWKNFLIKHFVKAYNVDMTTAAQPDPLAYTSFNDFFTRQLKSDARPIETNHTITSPADGCISQIGNIQQGRIIQAKGFDFTVNELIGGDDVLASQFVDGKFATIYLAPKDYHRVHMPFAGSLRRMIYIPGKLFSVNTTTSENIPRLFARNERVVCLFDTDIGPMAVVMVGAFFVASIALTWCGVVAPSHTREVTITDYQPGTIQLQQGDEMGYFKLGSTVITLFPANTLEWQAGLNSQSAIVMGQKLGILKN
jgi:phosphatidylserine decarboxylase